MQQSKVKQVVTQFRGLHGMSAVAGGLTNTSKRGAVAPAARSTAAKGSSTKTPAQK